MKLFSQRAELKRQISETRVKKIRYEASLQATRAKVHDRMTSPVTLASSFAAGAIVGYIATRKSKEKDLLIDEPGQSSASVETPKRSLASKFTKDLVGIGLSLVLAEATKQMKQKINQSSDIEIANPPGTREGLELVEDVDTG